MNQSNRGLWIGVIVIVIIAALGIWWIASSQPAAMDDMTATSTAATSTGTSGGPAVTNETGTSVQAIVASLSGASNFQSEFSSTGVGATFKAGTKYTVFVPLDTAYSNVTKGTISKMTGAQLKRLVEYQVIAKEVQVGTQTLGSEQALSGDPLNFSDTNNIPMVNSAIVVSEYKGSNGIVYVINDVLIPPQTSTI